MLWDSISTPEHVLQNVQSSLKQKYQNTHWTWTCFHFYQGSKWKRGIDSALNFTLACQNRLERGGLPGPGPAIPIFPRAPHNSIIFHQPLVPLWLSARKRKQTVRMIHDPASRCLHNSVTYWENKRKEKIKNEFFQSPNVLFITFCFLPRTVFPILDRESERERQHLMFSSTGSMSAYKCKCKCNVWSITASPGDDKYALRCPRAVSHTIATPSDHLIIPLPLICRILILLFLANENRKWLMFSVS